MGAWGLHGVDEVHVDLMHIIVPGAQNGTVLKTRLSRNDPQKLFQPAL
jgi:hypothetical protein